ncbi:MAG: DUF1292 domain-containing protein [Lachnospiraceae bacterium]|nr:DUF1292 domain-containing protein [Lachnospiraceae bacterium]
MAEVDLMEDVRVTLELDEGDAVECRILTIFSAGGRDYIALIPQDENGEDNADGEIYLYRYAEDEEGNPSLDNIETDEEYELASAAFSDLPIEDTDDPEE